jgi:hypothetical protein
MTQVLKESMRSLRASPFFAFYVLIALGVAGFIALLFGQMALGLDFFLPGIFGQMEHGMVESHRVHDFAFGLLITTGLVGLVAQLRRPSANVAGMVMALIPFAGLLLAAVLAGGGTLGTADIAWRRNPLYLFAAVAAVAALLHPRGRDFFRSLSFARINWVMLALVGIAAVPLLGFAATNIRLQETALDDHVFLMHYAFMAALAFTVIGVGVLASLRPDGWRLTAWVAGLLPAVLGVWSMLFPNVGSSLDLGWALAAIAWGATFIAVAERTKGVEGPTLLGPRSPLSRRESRPTQSALIRSGEDRDRGTSS